MWKKKRPQSSEATPATEVPKTYAPGPWPGLESGRRPFQCACTSFVDRRPVRRVRFSATGGTAGVTMRGVG
jgi:hypothetical protein